MGMSASQARMLSLTARLSDLEYTAQNVSNSKIRLADKAEEASRSYQDALNKEKVTVLSSDSSTYIDATAFNLTTYHAVSATDKQRLLTDAEGRVLVTEKVGQAYDDSKNIGSESALLKATYATVDAYLRASLGYSTEAEASTAGLTYNKDQVAYYTNRYTGLEAFLNKSGYTSDPNTTGTIGSGASAISVENDAGATSYYSNIYDEISKHGYNSPGDDKMKDSEWLYSQLSSGNIFLNEYDIDKKLEQVSYTSGDASLQVKSDTTEVAKAEAEYNTTMAAIQSKDKKFDLQLKELDTEHTAIQTEIESVKKVIDKNIERSFKVFNA